ncbi:hypothetical protein T492DRAFT_1093172 [Pavlovales sp. CCMP2436]|nr:hypothetical protein T492DRAFT_1093172 [Pavlovales sp. CCMP2436]
MADGADGSMDPSFLHPHLLHHAANHSEHMHLQPSAIIAVGLLVAIHVAALGFWLMLLLVSSSQRARTLREERRMKSA